MTLHLVLKVILEYKNISQVTAGLRIMVSRLATPTLLYFSTVRGPRPQPKVKETPLPTPPASLLSSGGAASGPYPHLTPPPASKDLPRRAQNEGPPPKGLCLQPADSVRFLTTRRRLYAPKTNATHHRALPQASLPPLPKDLGPQLGKMLETPEPP